MSNPDSNIVTLFPERQRAARTSLQNASDRLVQKLAIPIKGPQRLELEVPAETYIALRAIGAIHCKTPAECLRDITIASFPGKVSQ